MMLILTRKQGERIVIGKNAELTHKNSQGLQSHS